MMMLHGRVDVSQTSFSHISTNSLMIPTVSKPASLKPLRRPFNQYQSCLKAIKMAEILGRSTGNHHGTIY